MEIDAGVAEWLNGLGSSHAARPALVWAANDLALVLVATLVVGGLALAAWELLRGHQLRFNLIEGAATALLALGLGLFINQTIGAAWARARPYDVVSGVNLLVSPSRDPSFPSDHATAAFCLALGIGIASARLRDVLLLEGVFLGVARVAVGLHYPTDIIAGLFVAFVAVGVANELILVSRGKLASVMSGTVGRVAPIGDPAPIRPRRRLTPLSACAFAALLGMPAVVEAAGDPFRLQPEWLEGAILAAMGLGLAATWLAMTRAAAHHLYLRGG